MRIQALKRRALKGAPPVWPLLLGGGFKKTDEPLRPPAHGAPKRPWGVVGLVGEAFAYGVPSTFAPSRVQGLGRCLVRLYPKLHFVCLAFIHLARII